LLQQLLRLHILKRQQQVQPQQQILPEQLQPVLVQLLQVSVLLALRQIQKQVIRRLEMARRQGLEHSHLLVLLQPELQIFLVRIQLAFVQRQAMELQQALGQKLHSVVVKQIQMQQHCYKKLLQLLEQQQPVIEQLMVLLQQVQLEIRLVSVQVLLLVVRLLQLLEQLVSVQGLLLVVQLLQLLEQQQPVIEQLMVLLQQVQLEIQLVSVQVLLLVVLLLQRQLGQFQKEHLIHLLLVSVQQLLVQFLEQLQSFLVG
jgi:hypothetical protein